MISRRTLITGAAALAAAASLPRSAQALTGCIPGAIRFDPWYVSSGSYPDLNISTGSQNFFGPQAWQFRAPWFCSARNISQLSCDATQGNMDSEIQCAVNAGIKFWAYDEFSTTSSLRVAWNFHQSSSLKNSVNWCWISNLGSIGSTGNFSTQVAAYVANYQASNYQTVLSGRPLHFILWSSSNFASHWGSSLANVAAMITALRAACGTAGIGNPYIVVMDSPFSNLAAPEAAGIGADATSFYNTSFVGTYASLVTRCEGQWTSQAGFASSASLGFIPTSVTGWDTRPQLQSPTSFTGNPYAYQSEPAPFVGMGNFASPGTISQVVSHVSDCVTFTKTNAAVCASTAMLLCAWDECGEEGGSTTGGGLIPTIGDPFQAGNTNNILSAIAAVLS